MRRFLLVVIAVLAASCGNTARPDFVVHLVDAQNGNPFVVCDSGTVRIDVQQGTNAVLTTNGNITGTGRIADLSVEVPSYGLVTQIGVTVHCTGASGDVTLHGATPHFVPVGYGFVNVVLGQPRHCELLNQPSLISTRIGPQLVTLHANVIAIGGLEGATHAPSTRVQQLDPVTLTSNAPANPYDSLSIPVGLGHSVAVDDTHLVFASDSNTGIFDATASATTPVTDITHHTGASDAAVVSLNASGVAIVGGVLGGNPTTTITWIDDQLHVSETALAHPRRRPGATLVGNHVLVVGGQDPGDPLFELVPLFQDASISFGPTEQRFAPVVVSSRDHSRAFVALGTDAVDGGNVLGTTWALSTCTAAGCMSTAGPMVSDLRTDVSVVDHVVGTASGTEDYEVLLFGGTEPGAAPMSSLLIDRIHFEADGTVTIAPAGMLFTARAQAGATEIGGGVTIVAGGIDDHGNAVGSIEICFPEFLRPVGPE